MLDALKHKILAIPFAVISCVSAMAGNPKVMTGIEVLENMVSGKSRGAESVL